MPEYPPFLSTNYKELGAEKLAQIALEDLKGTRAAFIRSLSASVTRCFSTEWAECGSSLHMQTTSLDNENRTFPFNYEKVLKVFVPCAFR
ncbi:hypothetical protein [uncultured Ruegeria sp.]|uniref:hypothetical protein n=1 Tax=uncultured Ruegeria sp. TaxID=259304 RepID=UPI0026254D61|nr:hypothetical protein [uncultured Ruegeria sp.]